MCVHVFSLFLSCFLSCCRVFLLVVFHFLQTPPNGSRHYLGTYLVDARTRLREPTHTLQAKSVWSLFHFFRARARVQVGRRYKITNPEKFRDFYGKMMYMLQDAQAYGRAGLELVNDIKVGGASGYGDGLVWVGLGWDWGETRHWGGWWASRLRRC